MGMGQGHWAISLAKAGTPTRRFAAGGDDVGSKQRRTRTKRPPGMEPYRKRRAAKRGWSHAGPVALVWILTGGIALFMAAATARLGLHGIIPGRTGGFSPATGWLVVVAMVVGCLLFTLLAVRSDQPRKPT